MFLKVSWLKYGITANRYLKPTDLENHTDLLLLRIHLKAHKIYFPKLYCLHCKEKCIERNGPHQL